VALRLLIAAAGTIAFVACGEARPTYGPAGEGARDFRPIGDVFFLADYVPVVPVEGAAKVPDSKIEWNVRAKLHDAGVEGVRVSVREQVVVLEGKVPDPDKKQAVEQLALSVHGAAGVRNKLEVGQ
jgi:hypothetical protein